MLSVYAGTSRESAPKVVKSIVNEFRQLKEVPITEDELKRAKDQLKGSLMLAWNRARRVCRIWRGRRCITTTSSAWTKLSIVFRR